MKQIVRFGLALGLLLLLTVGGSWRASAPDSTPLSLTQTAQPEPKAASGDDRDFQHQGQVASVVNDFIRAVQKKEWARAAEFFSADFRRAHQKELLDGSLLGFDPHVGKSTQSILQSPGPWVDRVAIRGERAWALLDTGGDPWSQRGLMALELVREGGQWKVLCFPPSEGAIDALRAGHDGEAAGRWFWTMLSDGDFSREEQARMAEVLGAYYGMAVVKGSWVEGRKPSLLLRFRQLMSAEVHRATMEELTRIAEELKAWSGLKMVKVEFWREPDNDVVAVAQALADQAIRRIYQDIEAAKGEFPELALFDGGHVRLQEGGLFYAPTPPVPRQMGSKPTVGVWIRPPQLRVSQVTFPLRIILPRQKLAVVRHVSVDDQRLGGLVEQIIERNLGPLESFEKILGGEPVLDHWSSRPRPLVPSSPNAPPGPADPQPTLKSGTTLRCLGVRLQWIRAGEQVLRDRRRGGGQGGFGLVLPEWHGEGLDVEVEEEVCVPGFS